jgi:hypothetical protein
MLRLSNSKIRGRLALSIFSMTLKMKRRKWRRIKRRSVVLMMKSANIYKKRRAKHLQVTNKLT